MPDLTERIAALPPEKRQLFEKLLKQERLEIRQPVIPTQPRGQGTNKFVASFAQQRLWFIDSFEPHGSAYNMPFAVRLAGSLDVTLTLNERRSCCTPGGGRWMPSVCKVAVVLAGTIPGAASRDTASKR